MSKKATLNKEGWTRRSEDWGRTTSPDRPSRYEIEIYEDYVQKIAKRSEKKIEALILGATPELRDMLAKYNANVTLADINLDMVKAMEPLLEYSNGKEKVVISNWLDIPLKPNSFDVILCDHGICHIPFEKWDAFLAEQARLLKKGGHLITSIVTLEQSELRDVKEMVDAFKNNIFTREDKYYYHWACIMGLNDCDDKLHLKSFGEYNNQLEGFLNEKVITKRQFEFLRSPWYEFKATFPPKEVVDAVVAKSFTTKSIRFSTINRALTCHQIYFCQKK